MELKKVADRLQNKLLEAGFIVHRYDAYSTNSIYLKLDWGACHSIRISDHNGKKHLSYKYNVILGENNKGWRKDDRQMWRYYCGTSKERLDELVEQILMDKAYIKAFSNYNKLMEQYKNQKDEAIGFWSDAKEVKLIESAGVTETNNQ